MDQAKVKYYDACDGDPTHFLTPSRGANWGGEVIIVKVHKFGLPRGDGESGLRAEGVSERSGTHSSGMW